MRGETCANEGQVDLLIFDKDGVLLDLTKTWLPVAIDITHLLSKLTNGKVPAPIFQNAIGIDEASQSVDPNGLFAAGSSLDQQVACAAIAPELSAHFPTQSYRDAITAIVAKNALRPPMPHGDIKTALQTLHDAGYPMAILTNDSEQSARSSLERLDIAHFFGMVVGYDTGYGGKPDPTGFHAICQHFGKDAAHTIMIGDTGADKGVADAAGAGRFIGISANYPDPTDALQGTDHLLPNIETLPALLASLKS